MYKICLNCLFMTLQTFLISLVFSFRSVQFSQQVTGVKGESQIWLGGCKYNNTAGILGRDTHSDLGLGTGNQCLAIKGVVFRLSLSFKHVGELATSSLVIFDGVSVYQG